MNVAIIAAAGQGTRIGGKKAKQFLQLAGIPIIVRTLQQFEKCDSIQEVVVVLAASESSEFLSLADQYGLRKLTRIVPGGATRAESVFRGLQSIRSSTAQLVVIHDAVRPFVTVDEIMRTIEAAKVDGAAILVGPVTDTIKQIEGSTIVKTLDRVTLRRALTPQCFRYDWLCEAFAGVDLSDPALTDESFLIERLGRKVAVVEGSAQNIKITHPSDLRIAEALLKIR